MFHLPLHHTEEHTSHIRKGKTMKVKNNKFFNNSDNEVQGDFERAVGDSNIWFSDMLYSMKSEWINKGFPISDILIREQKPIMVASLKTYIPFRSKAIKDNFLPTKTSMLSIVSRFVDIDESQNESIYEFSIAIYGLGVFRVSYSTDEIGAGMSIRYLSFTLPSLNSMSYPPYYEKFIKDLVSNSTVKAPFGQLTTSGIRTGGLILHVGATGAGKSTSIASEVGYLAEEITGTIITYENPIEYRYIATKAPVRQYELGVNIKADESYTMFENVKRHLLRNNPSVVVFGEARGHDEIREVVDAAARGHLVFATIHASTVMEALSTLMSALKNELHLLQHTLQAIVAHKLEVNKKGDFVPLYEIFTPNGVVKSKIREGDLKGIADVFISGDGLPNSVTFIKSLHNAQKEEKFTVDEVKKIKRTSYGAYAE